MALGMRTPTWRTGAPLTPAASVLRGLSILAIVWQGLWILPNPQLWPTSATSILGSVLLGATLVTWLLVVWATWGRGVTVRRLTRLHVLNLAVVYAAAIDLMAAGVIDVGDGWREGASLLNLAVGLTGLLLAARIAVPIVCGAVLTETVLLALAHPLGAAGTGSDQLLYALYALAIGSATIGGRRALVLAAQRTERARIDLQSAEAQATAMRQVQARLRDQTRRLHETVLNTLTAIARGGLSSHGSDLDRIRTRCRASVEVLADFADPDEAQQPVASATWIDELRPPIDALIERGVSVEVSGDIDSQPPVDVRRAMSTAAVEALSNVARHAGAAQVSIMLRNDGSSGSDQFEIVIRDDGVGFDMQEMAARFGMNEAIRGPLSEVGGTARIESIPGDGTSVTLRWSAITEDPGRDAPFDTTAFVVPVLVSFGVFSAASMVLTLAECDSPVLCLIAFAVALASGLVLARFARGGALPARVVLGVCLAVPLVYRLQELGVGAGPATPWSDWASEAIVGLLLVVAAAGPWWGWIVALGAWLLTQGDVVTELVQPGTAIVVAGGLFARSVRGNAQAYGEAMKQRGVELAAALSDAEAVRRLRLRYSALAQSGADQLLEEIANGTLNPASDAVRVRCADEERFIRSVMLLDPAGDPLHAFASHIAAQAHRSGRVVEINLAELPPLDAEVVAQLQAATEDALVLASSHEPVRLTARREGELIVVRLVVPLTAQDQRRVSLTSPDPELQVMASDTDGVVMWELHVA